MKKLLIAALATLALCVPVSAAKATLPIYVTNRSALPDSAVRNDLRAFQRNIRDIRAWWGGPYRQLRFVKAAPPGHWRINIVKDENQGYLGYHDLDNELTPYAVIDVVEGYSWTNTFSHELEEMWVDPFIDQYAFPVPGLPCIKEIADPVESETLGYYRLAYDGSKVLLSDFVGPAWFNSANKTGPYDFMGFTTMPWQVLADGYQWCGQ